jgi:hypothetical protein
MVSPDLMGHNGPTERSPLLSGRSGRLAEPSNDAFPSFPERGKTRSYSHSHWLAPDEDSSSRPEPEAPAQFQENGLLSGISRTKFRLIYGGILLGYFVRALMQSHFDILTVTRWQCLIRHLWLQVIQSLLPISTPQTQRHGFPRHFYLRPHRFSHSSEEYQIQSVDVGCIFSGSYFSQHPQHGVLLRKALVVSLLQEHFVELALLEC